MHVIEGAVVLMVLIILFVIYRNPFTMMLPLVTIGVSVGVAQSIVAGVAELGLGVSSQTITLMTTMMAGAGIDYAVFLISRYHDYLRQGMDSDEAVVKALTSIGKVIAGSAATVSITFLGMVFTHLGSFRNVGPCLAISIALAFLAAVTFLPALMVLVGRRDWIKPRRDLTTRFWRRLGNPHRASTRESSGRQPRRAGHSGRLRVRLPASTTTTARRSRNRWKAPSAIARWPTIFR